MKAAAEMSPAGNVVEVPRSEPAGQAGQRHAQGEHRKAGEPATTGQRPAAEVGHGVAVRLTPAPTRARRRWPRTSSSRPSSSRQKATSTRASSVAAGPLNVVRYWARIAVVSVG